MQSRSTIYLARSGRADSRIVSAVRQYLKDNDYKVKEYEGGTYDTALEEFKMRSCDFMLVIPELQTEYSKYLKDQGMIYNEGCMIGKGLYEQITFFSKTSLNAPLIVTDVGIVTCIEEKDFSEIEEYLEVVDYVNLEVPQPITSSGIILGAWGKTYAICHTNIKTELALEKVFTPLKKREKKVFSQWRKSSKEILQGKPKEVNYLLIASLY